MLDNFPKDLHLINGKVGFKYFKASAPIHRPSLGSLLPSFLYGSSKPSPVPGTKQEPRVCCIKVTSFITVLLLHCVYPTALSDELP